MSVAPHQKRDEASRDSNEPGENQDPIVVTPRASRMVAQHFKDKEKVPIRLFVKLGNCGIRSFAAALEKPKKNDVMFEIDGFQYYIDKTVLQDVRPVKVDSDGYGFRISATGIAPPSGCGTCGYMCQDGRRCSGDCAACDHLCPHGRRKLAAQASPNKSNPR